MKLYSVFHCYTTTYGITGVYAKRDQDPGQAVIVPGLCHAAIEKRSRRHPCAATVMGNTVRALPPFATSRASFWTPSSIITESTIA